MPPIVQAPLAQITWYHNIALIEKLVALIGCYSGAPEEGAKVMQPMHDLGDSVADLMGPMPYVQMQGLIDALWPKGTKVAPDGDVYAFYLPTMNDKFGKPVLGGGTFLGAFQDRPEIQAFQYYVASPAFSDRSSEAASSWRPANIDGRSSRQPRRPWQTHWLQPLHAGSLLPHPSGRPYQR